MAEVIVFYSIASLLVFCSIMVVTRKNPIASAIYLVGALFLVAAVFAFLGADFVAAIQVLVYAGAIMVLFLFVIMLLNIDPELLKSPPMTAGEAAVLILTILSFIVISVTVFKGQLVAPVGELTTQEIAKNGGNTAVIGLALFMKYVWPFELASFLILLAIVASVVIAKKDKKKLTGDQADAERNMVGDLR